MQEHEPIVVAIAEGEAAHLNIESSELKDESKLIGSSDAGSPIYRAWYRGQNVIVKTIPFTPGTTDTFEWQEQFINEVRVHRKLCGSKLGKAHIVQLDGICFGTFAIELH